MRQFGRRYFTCCAVDRRAKSRDPTNTGGARNNKRNNQPSSRTLGGAAVPLVAAYCTTCSNTGEAFGLSEPLPE